MKIVGKKRRVPRKLGRLIKKYNLLWILTWQIVLTDLAFDYTSDLMDTNVSANRHNKKILIPKLFFIFT